MNIGTGTKDDPFTHGKCRDCGKVAKVTPRFDYWGKEGQPLLCDRCKGPYGSNPHRVEQ